MPTVTTLYILGPTLYMSVTTFILLIFKFLHWLLNKNNTNSGKKKNQIPPYPPHYDTCL